MYDPNCIFCKIVKGEIPCAEVHRSDNVLAFLDIAPVNKGHALVIPTAHYPMVFDIPTLLGAELLDALQRVAQAVTAATGAAGVNLGMNNGAAAGQLVPHAHWHVIPRFEDDGLTLWQQNSYADNDEMDRMAAAIREHRA